MEVKFHMCFILIDLSIIWFKKVNILINHNTVILQFTSLNNIKQVTETSQITKLKKHGVCTLIKMGKRNHCLKGFCIVNDNISRILNCYGNVKTSQQKKGRIKQCWIAMKYFMSSGKLTPKFDTWHKACKYLTSYKVILVALGQSLRIFKCPVTVGLPFNYYPNIYIDVLCLLFPCKTT
jgi:hypothetical protein